MTNKNIQNMLQRGCEAAASREATTFASRGVTRNGEPTEQEEKKEMATTVATLCC